jgi:ABC-type xylose transport system substrate-binding protein
MNYRRVGDITADELLSHLTSEPQFQASLFVKMGGDPADHNYARLSYLTQELRARGINVKSSRTRGLWI